MADSADDGDAAGAPTVVCVAGPSDAGKTSLIETVVSELTERHRVATVKSIHHDIEPDDPGTDTHRHREAGADTAVGITPSYTFEVTPGGKETGTRSDERAALERALDRLASRGYDVVLVEGFGSVPLPTVALGDRNGIRGDVIATGDASVDEVVAAIERLDPASIDR